MSLTTYLGWLMIPMTIFWYASPSFSLDKLLSIFHPQLLMSVHLLQFLLVILSAIRKPLPLLGIHSTLYTSLLEHMSHSVKILRVLVCLPD